MSAANTAEMNAGAGGQEAAALPARDINPWLIAVTVMLATFMEVLDTSVANVALPHIAGSMSATTDETTWVLTAYLVANAIVLPLSGWFSTLFGRKNFYIACVVLFTVSSTLCGLAPSLLMLVIFRILQGLGGGALQPISQAVLRETFPREKQGMAMAVYGMGVVFAPVLGPTLGGWITDNFSWRWIFLINIPVGILSILFTTVLIHDPPYLKRRDRSKKLHIDYIGLSLLTIGLAALEIALDEGQRNDWFESPMIIAAALIAVLSIATVIWWELRQKDPVIELHLLGERNFAISTFMMFMLGFILYGSTMLLPLFLQTMLGYTATQSGMALSPGGIVIMVLMPIVGFLMMRIQSRWLVMFGLLVSSYGLFKMTNFNVGLDFSHAVWARIIQSVGLAFLFVPINTMAFYFIDKTKVSYATGLINLARNVGGSAGIAIASTLLARRQQFHQSVLVSHLTPLDPAYNQMLQGSSQMLQQQGHAAADAISQAYGMLYGTVLRHATMLAFIDVVYVMAIAFLAMMPLMFLMKKMEPHKGEIAIE